MLAHRVLLYLFKRIFQQIDYGRNFPWGPPTNNHKQSLSVLAIVGLSHHGGALYHESLRPKLSVDPFVCQPT